MVMCGKTGLNDSGEGGGVGFRQEHAGEQLIAPGLVHIQLAGSTKWYSENMQLPRKPCLLECEGSRISVF